MGKTIEGFNNQKWVSHETGCALALGADLLLKAAAIVALVGVFGSYWSHGPLTASGTPTLHQIGQFIANNWWGTALVGLAILFGPAVALKAYDRYQKGRETATQNDRVADQQRQAGAAGMGAGAGADGAGDAVPASPAKPRDTGKGLTAQDLANIDTFRAKAQANLQPEQSSGFKLSDGSQKVFYKNKSGSLKEARFAKDQTKMEGNYDSVASLVKKYKPVDAREIMKK